MYALRLIICGLALSGWMFLAPGASSAGSTATWLQGWPDRGHDPQRTARAPVAGPTNPRLLLSIKGIGASVIAPDGTIYGCAVTAGPWHQSRLVALDANGHRLWQRHPCMETVLAPDGTLLMVGWNPPRGEQMFTDGDTAAMAYSSQGQRLWKIQPFGQLKGAELLVGADDRLYVPIIGHDTPYDGLNVMTSAGKILRRYGYKLYVSALGPDGSLYGIVEGGDGVIALDANGRVRWQTPLIGSELDYGLGRIVVGSDSTIYASSGDAIEAFNSVGKPLWKVKRVKSIFNLALRADGVLLASGERYLWAIRRGAVLWRRPVGRSALYDGQSLIVDTAGTAYAGTADGKVRIFSAAGRLLKTLAVSPRAKPRVAQAPGLMIAPDGRLVVSTGNGVLRIYG